MEKMTKNTTNSADSGSKIASFKAKQNMPYDFKVNYAKIRAREFYNECGKRDLDCYVSVGGLDSITLLLFLRSIGIDVPAVSVSSLEDVSIQRVHKKLAIGGMLCGHSITFCRNFLISPKRNRQRMRENHGQRRMMRCFAGCMTRAAAKKNFVLTLSARRGESRRVWYGWGKLQRVMSLKNRRDQVPPPEFNQRRYFLIVFNLLLQQTEIPLEAICCIE